MVSDSRVTASTIRRRSSRCRWWNGTVDSLDSASRLVRFQAADSVGINLSVGSGYGGVGGAIVTKQGGRRVACAIVADGGAESEVIFSLHRNCCSPNPL